MRMSKGREIIRAIASITIENDEGKKERKRKKRRRMKEKEKKKIRRRRNKKEVSRTDINRETKIEKREKQERKV